MEGASEGKWAAAKASEENKENLLVHAELPDGLLLSQDEEVLNDSIISGERGLRGQSHEAVSLGTDPACAVALLPQPEEDGGTCTCEGGREPPPSKGGTDWLRRRDVSQLV